MNEKIRQLEMELAEEKRKEISAVKATLTDGEIVEHKHELGVLVHIEGRWHVVPFFGERISPHYLHDEDFMYLKRVTQENLMSTLKNKAKSALSGSRRRY